MHACDALRVAKGAIEADRVHLAQILDENARLRGKFGFLPRAEDGRVNRRALKPYTKIKHAQRTKRNASVRLIGSGLRTLAGACPLRPHPSPPPPPPAPPPPPPLGESTPGLYRSG